MEVLAIGNSFSQDAMRYLHQIAKADCVELNCFNLFIGGCSLFRHFKNMKGDLKEYTLEMNGESTGFYVTLKEALLNRRWDVITIQQASHESTDFENFTPYIYELAAYIRELSPKAKLYIHQTWGYESGSIKIKNRGYEKYDEMFADVEKTYAKVKDGISADGIVPSGKMLGKLLENGVEKIHRDGSHLSFGLGRFATALLWYKTLTGNSVLKNSFSDFDEEIPENEIEIAKKVIDGGF